MAQERPAALPDLARPCRSLRMAAATGLFIDVSRSSCPPASQRRSPGHTGPLPSTSTPPRAAPGASGFPPTAHGLPTSSRPAPCPPPLAEVVTMRHLVRPRDARSDPRGGQNIATKSCGRLSAGASTRAAALSGATVPSVTVSRGSCPPERTRTPSGCCWHRGVLRSSPSRPGLGAQSGRAAVRPRRYDRR
jgi:hypothetical protein